MKELWERDVWKAVVEAWASTDAEKWYILIPPEMARARELTELILGPDGVQQAAKYLMEETKEEKA